MAKYRIVLECDNKAAFDMLKLQGGETVDLGNRIAGLLLTGELGFADAIGLACYGTILVSSEEVKALTEVQEKIDG